MTETKGIQNENPIVGEVMFKISEGMHVKGIELCPINNSKCKTKSTSLRIIHGSIP